MTERSTDIEPKGKKETLKMTRSASNDERIEVYVEVVDGADGAKLNHTILSLR